jgi:hypothetical protein
MRQQIFWKACIVLLLDVLAEPHITTLYAHNACRRVLYNIILRFNESFERRSSLNRWSLEFNFLRLSLRWDDHVRRLSYIKPRYFISFEWGIIVLFIVMGGHIWGLSENVMKEDFDSYTLIFHLTNHSEIMSMCVWSWWLAVILFEAIDKSAISSA